MADMTNFSQSPKPHQVFISFRGKSQRENLVSILKSDLEASNIKVFVDEYETRGNPITKLFERIKESSVALIIFSKKYPESRWCLDELVEIKKQMDAGSLVPFPVFYNVKADSVKKQTGFFRNSLLKTEDNVRRNVDRNSSESILETEAMIWQWRQALVSVGARMGFSYRHSSVKAFVSDLVVEVKEVLDHIPSPRNDLITIEKPLMHPHEALMSLLQDLNLKKSDLKDLITKPSIDINKVVPLSTDDPVFLDLTCLKNPVLAQILIQPGQDGKYHLVFLGSLNVYNEEFAFKPLLLPKKHQKCPAAVGNRCQTAVSNDYIQNCPREDNNFNAASFLYNILMIICPPSAFISFGEKQIGETVVSSLKKELESNRMSVHIQGETKEGIRESRVAIVVFSAKYPESEQCLDELVEIKKLMDAGEIDPFPIFYKIEAKSVKEIKGWFRNRLLKIENKVRNNVNRGNDASILDTEARIWGWREALLSIASRTGLTYQNSSISVFASDVVTKVKDIFVFRKKPSMQQQQIEAVTTAVRSFEDDLFYSLTSFLQALNLEITDLEGYREIPNGLVSLSLNGHTNLLLLKTGSPISMVLFQYADSFKHLTKVFALNSSGVIKFEESSQVLASQSNNNNKLF